MTEANQADFQFVATTTHQLCMELHNDAVTAGWWTDIKTGESTVGTRDFIQMVGLIITEIAEAYEGLDARADEKLPDRPALEVELADTFIRMADTSIGNGVDMIKGFSGLFEFAPWVPSDHLHISGVPDRMMRIILFLSNSIEGQRKRDFAKRDAEMCKAICAVMTLSSELSDSPLIRSHFNGYRINVRAAINAKRAFNRERPDHKMENRLKEGGKKE